MTRITNEMRNSIAHNATKNIFDVQGKAIKQEESDLAIELYNSLFESKELGQIKKLPKKWFHYDGCLRFNCAGYDLTFCVFEAVPVPYDRGYCSRLGNITGDLAEKAQAFGSKKEGVKDEQNKTRQTIKSLLYSVNTIKQLKTVWPEGAEFYAIYDEASTKSKGGVPAVQIEEINKLLGLGGNA